jgi:hypothetical protein
MRCARDRAIACHGGPGTYSAQADAHVDPDARMVMRDEHELTMTATTNPRR